MCPSRNYRFIVPNKMSGDLPRCSYKERDQNIYVDYEKKWVTSIVVVVVLGFVCFIAGMAALCRRTSAKTQSIKMAAYILLALSAGFLLIAPPVIIKVYKSTYVQKILKVEQTECSACEAARRIPRTNEGSMTNVEINDTSSGTGARMQLNSLFLADSETPQIISRLIVYSTVKPTLLITGRDNRQVSDYSAFVPFVNGDMNGFQLKYDYVVPNNATVVVPGKDIRNVTCDVIYANIPLAQAEFYLKYDMFAMDCNLAMVIDSTGKIQEKKLSCCVEEFAA